MTECAGEKSSIASTSHSDTHRRDLSTANAVNVPH